MLKSVQDSSRRGVGIAAPQVGINRNLIWVQRFDKPGQPFEFYINPKIVWRSSILCQGPEGIFLLKAGEMWYVISLLWYRTPTSRERSI